MRAVDLLASAISNTFRSKTRTILTILAIFVGAFTLTITNGLGTGINRYIDDTVSSVGAADVMTVTKPAEGGTPGLTSGPVEYDPDAVSSGQGPAGGTVIALTPDDVTELEGIDGVLRVHPNKSVGADYLQYDDGTRYVIDMGTRIPGQTLPLTTGTAPDDDAARFEVAIPEVLVEPLGFADAADALGSTVQIAVSDAVRTQHVVDATVTAVTEETLVAGSSVIANQPLTDELFALQNTGVPEDQQDRWASASITFAADATPAQVDALKDALADAGYTGTTVDDQLGAFTAVIDGIVLVLNAFAVIALLAAGFGIVNTLLMSVQERTREIGLMKAMGMGSGRVFTLFSLEAVFIGFLGSAIGVVIGMLAGSVVSSALARGLFSDLPGLQLIAFDPASVIGIVLIVMGIAFLAGTLPAARAARANPVDSLRYE